MRDIPLDARMCAWCAQSFVPKHPEHTECSVYPCAIAIVNAERGIDFTPAWAMVEIIKGHS
jgi:hypothetical protein